MAKHYRELSGGKTGTLAPKQCICRRPTRIGSSSSTFEPADFWQKYDFFELAFWTCSNDTTPNATAVYLSRLLSDHPGTVRDVSTEPNVLTHLYQRQSV